MQPVIDRVGLRVRDLDRLRRFYEAVIGLRELDAGPGLAVLGAGGVPLLTLHHDPAALPDDGAEAGLFHTAFLLPDRASLGRWLARGHALDGAADHLVSEAFYLRDPEGNGVEVYADRPAATWCWDAGRVAMANKPVDRAGLLALADRPFEAAPPGTRVGHVHLRVGDTGPARSFLVDELGFDVTAARPGALFTARGGYHHHVAANTWSSAGAGARNPRRAGLESVTIRGGADARGRTLRDPWGTTFHIQPNEENHPA